MNETANGRGERPPGTPLSGRVVPLCSGVLGDLALQVVILFRTVGPLPRLRRFGYPAVSVPFPFQSLYRPRPTFPVGKRPRGLTRLVDTRYGNRSSALVVGNAGDRALRVDSDGWLLILEWKAGPRRGEAPGIPLPND